MSEFTHHKPLIESNILMICNFEHDLVSFNLSIVLSEQPEAFIKGSKYFLFTKNQWRLYLLLLKTIFKILFFQERSRCPILHQFIGRNSYTLYFPERNLFIHEFLSGRNWYINKIRTGHISTKNLELRRNWHPA